MAVKKAFAALVAALMCLISSSDVTYATGPVRQGVVTDQGLVAIDGAARARRYLFVFFYNQDDQQTRIMGEVFKKATDRVIDRADAIAVLTTSSSERGIVTKFGVDRAPMPLVLVLAPNGAITGSFHTSFTEEQILKALVSSSEAKTLKALQQGKLVLVCVQNGNTRFNAEAMRGVTAFKADQRYGQATEIVKLDPASQDARPFLAKLGVGFPMNQAVTFFIAPPGSIIGQFQGATDKNQLIAAVTSAISGCGAGCKPGSCSVK